MSYLGVNTSLTGRRWVGPSEDEARHAELAQQAGAARLPRPIQGAMAVTADLMKAIVHRF